MELTRITAHTRLTNYFPVPRSLLELELPSSAILLYGLLLDRSTLSQKNDFTDTGGWVYVLILDDFGVERHTEFAQEQMYHIINGRYNRKKPMVITTNMTLQQLKNPASVAEQRLYDRILEICVPVCFDGESLRREKAAENLQFFRQLSETVAS